MQFAFELLLQDCSNCVARSICGDHEIVVGVRVLQHRRTGHCCLELVERLLVLLFPLEVAFLLGKLVELGGDGGVVLDVSPIEIGKNPGMSGLLSHLSVAANPQ